MRHVEAGSNLALGVRTLVAARRQISWKECGIIIILPGGGISRPALLGFRNTLGGRMPCGLSQALSWAPGPSKTDTASSLGSITI